MMKVYEVVEILIYFGALKYVAVHLVYLSLNTAQKNAIMHIYLSSQQSFLLFLLLFL